MRTRNLLPAILSAAILLSLTPALAQEGDRAQELATRLLGPWSQLSDTESRFEPGSLPSALEYELPVPGELELVGSYSNVETESGELQNGTIVFDAAASTQEVMQAVTAAFAEAGWSQQPQPQNVGFLPAHPDVHATFCSPDNELHIYLNAFGRGAQASDVRYEIARSGGYDACEVTPWAQEPILPPLPAPANSDIRIHAQNWFDDQASSSAYIETQQGVDEVEAHFSARLEAAGWSQAADGQWTKSVDESSWLGVLDLLRLQDGGYFATFVTVQAQESNQ